MSILHSQVPTDTNMKSLTYMEELIFCYAQHTNNPEVENQLC